MAIDSIPHRLLERGNEIPNLPAYYVRSGGRWQPTTWRDYADEVQTAAKAIIALGMKPGQSVCVLGFNRPEWVIADVGCMMAGGAPAGIYTTNSPVEVAYIVNHCEAPIIFLEDRGQWDKVDAQRTDMPKLKYAVMMKGAPKIDDPMVLSWEEFLAKAQETTREQLEERMDGLEEEQTATLIYTSGTTGPPKGVMLTHRNLSWTAGAAQHMVSAGPGDCVLSYLPLSHIAEQMFSIHAPITTGYSFYFAESIDKVADNLKEVQPTVFFGVPRIWEKFHAGVANKLSAATGVKAKLAAWAMDVGVRVNTLRNAGSEPGGLLALQYRIANKLIYSKVKEAVGLGRMRVGVSGAAPISREVIDFFMGLDVIINEVYGQSEDSGPTTFNFPGCTRIGSVGLPVDGVEVQIADDDEIIVRGPNVFKGYYKDKEATEATLIDGWLHSGDLGKFDRDGFLFITGRKKDIIITAGGKNIAPKNLEAGMKNCNLINEAVVIGDRRKFLSAVVTLDPETSEIWAGEHGADLATLHKNDELRKELQAHIDEMNTHFAKVETIKKFTILHRNFTVDDGELTPTLKVKRRIVYENFANEIEAMYS